MKHLILLMGVLLVLPLISEAKVAGDTDWESCPGEPPMGTSEDAPHLSPGRSACYNFTTKVDSALINLKGTCDLEFDSDYLTNGVDTAEIYLMRCMGGAGAGVAMTKADGECGRVFHVTTPMNGDDGSTTAQLRFLYDIPEGWYYIHVETAVAGDEIARAKIRCRATTDN